MELGFFAAMALSCAAQASYSGTLEMRHTGIGSGRNIRITVNSSVFDTFAGEILFSARNGSGDAAVFNNLTLPTFCVEPTQSVQSSWNVYSITDPGNAATPAMNLDRAAALNSATASFLQQKHSGNVTNELAAGFQIAVWEIIRDYSASTGRSSLDLSVGSFQAQAVGGGTIDPTISTWAQHFLDATSSTVSLAAYVFSNSSSQDQIIPNSGSSVLACLSLLYVVRRRRPSTAMPPPLALN